MRTSPDAGEPTLRWIERPWVLRTIALVYLGFGFASLAVSDYTGSAVAVVGALVAGLALGVCMWVFDRWWRQRPSVRQIRAKGGEFRRRAPGAVLLAGAILVGWLGYGGGPLAIVFTWTAAGLQVALVTPDHARRDAVRRGLRRTPTRPDVAG